MEKLIITSELFNIITERLKRKNLLPDILEYCEPTMDSFPILDYRFDVVSQLGFGWTSGIYLDLWITDGDRKIPLGVYKTASNDDRAMHAMATLLADFLLEIREYVKMYIAD